MQAHIIHILHLKKRAMRFMTTNKDMVRPTPSPMSLKRGKLGSQALLLLP